VVLRDEGAFRGRQPQQADPRGGGHPGQCRRQHDAARSVARARDPRVGRPGVSRPAGSDPPARTASAGFRQPPLSPSGCRGRGRAGEKPDQIEGARQKPALARAGVEHPIVIIKRVFGFANATAGSERTLIASLSPVRSPTCSSNAGISCATMWRNLSGSTTTGCRRRRRHTNNRAANPALSLAAAMAMADIYPQLPYSDPP